MSNFIAPIGNVVNKDAKTIDFDDVRDFGVEPIEADQDYPLILIQYKDACSPKVWEYKTEEEAFSALYKINDRVGALLYMVSEIDAHLLQPRSE